MTQPDELPFRIDWLAAAAEKKPAVTACNLGHLLINGRTCWQPNRVSADLQAIWFRWVEHENAETN